MSKANVLFTLLITGFINANGQEKFVVPTVDFAGDLKVLVETNSHTPNIINLASPEAIRIMNDATAAQVIVITEPYLNSDILNAKNVCWSLLSNALIKKADNETLKQKIAEVLCGNYFHNRYELQEVHNTLLLLKEKDFNANAKKYIATLADSLSVFDRNICAKILAIAQVKESIPALWRIANTNISTMSHSDVDVLASLARMGETKAGELLCDYYNSTRGSKGYRHIMIARNLAFSLNMSVLKCLIADYNTIDTSIHYRDVDVYINPAYSLGIHIAAMIKNYPYPKKDYFVDVKQLSGWLNKADEFELEER